MDPQHHDTAEYIADEGNDFRIQLDSADAAFNLGSPQFPHTPSYNGSYHNSPYSGHSELSFSGGDLGLFEEEAAVVPEYDPSEYDPPQSSSLLMFNDTDYSFSSVPVNVERGASYDYSSPSSTGSGEQRSRASSISQSGSPRMNVAQAFDNMTFRSPNWGTDPLPRDRPPSPHPKSPPRLMTAPIINAPEGDGLGPRLHIVPATPVSGGGAASAAVPFQTSLETLREPPQEQPLHFPRPRSSSDHDPPQWNDNFIGQMGNIGSALDDEAPRQRPSFNSFHFGDNNGFLSPDLRRSHSASEHTRPGHTRQTRSEDMRSLLPVDFSGPQFLSPVDPPAPVDPRARALPEPLERVVEQRLLHAPLAVPLPARLPRPSPRFPPLQLQLKQQHRQQTERHHHPHAKGLAQPAQAGGDLRVPRARLRVHLHTELQSEGAYTQP
ncbi:hypothetical protein R3P38DRAFT_3504487 [Favolaschia claudopus]|uniref:Uncharacterized protein n=1 Tax=Favolaschia claudopus TaxID=2862362 RepID=A0AAW0C4H7_9AGAR